MPIIGSFSIASTLCPIPTDVYMFVYSCLSSSCFSSSILMFFFVLIYIRLLKVATLLYKLRYFTFDKMINYQKLIINLFITELRKFSTNRNNNGMHRRMAYASCMRTCHRRILTTDDSPKFQSDFIFFVRNYVIAWTTKTVSFNVAFSYRLMDKYTTCLTS